MPLFVEVVFCAVLGVACLVGGLVLGFLPMKSDMMTETQTKVSQMVGFLIAVVFIMLMVTGLDAESWAMLIGVVLGYAIGKIPPLHRWVVGRWMFFQPKETKRRR